MSLGPPAEALRLLRLARAPGVLTNAFCRTVDIRDGVGGRFQHTDRAPGSLQSASS